MKILLQAATLTALIMVATMSEAQTTLRATEIDSVTWGKVFNGKLSGAVIEFREGDELPLTITAEGDFFETRRVQETPVTIKKDFWMKYDQNTVLFSLDGSSFKPLPQVATGNFLVGAGTHSGGARANTLNMHIKAFLK